ncbi:hypothetical protein M1D34_28695 (plasmid) [Ensifer sp. D2-11]
MEQRKKARSKCLSVFAPLPNIEALASDIEDPLEQIDICRTEGGLTSN